MERERKMGREKVKELIIKYKEDGFDRIDIELKGGKVININENDKLSFNPNFIVIMGKGYVFRIGYNFIEGIAI